MRVAQHLTGPHHAARAAPRDVRHDASRRRARPIRSSSPTSRRLTHTPAKTSSRSARTAARCCCGRSCARRWTPAAGSRSRASSRCARYLRGRIDLVQAEAVRDLIDAVTPLQARAAFDQLEGTLTGRIREIDARLFDLVARARGVARFPGRGLSLRRRGEAARELEIDRRAISALLATARARAADPRGPARRDRRPAERGQVEPVQPARRRGAGDRRGRCRGRRATC